jgi:hypothetical protein
MEKYFACVAGRRVLFLCRTTLLGGFRSETKEAIPKTEKPNFRFQIPKKQLAQLCSCRTIMIAPDRNRDGTYFRGNCCQKNSDINLKMYVFSSFAIEKYIPLDFRGK